MSASALATLSPQRCTQVGQLFRGLLATRAVTNFVRVLATRYSRDPLRFSGGPSRFSPLSTGQGRNPLFGIVYIAEDLATGIHETLIRDRLDLNPSRILMPSDYAGHDAVNISTSSGLAVTLADLTDGNAVRCGVPADVIRYSVHTDGQYFSEFVHANMPTVDGVLYSSRLTERRCIAIYDRALHKHAAASRISLTRSALRSTLEPWNVSVR